MAMPVVSKVARNVFGTRNDRLVKRYPHSPLYTSAASGRPAMVAWQVPVSVVLVLDEPWPVVTGEQNIGVVGETHLIDRVEDAPNTEIDFLDNVAVQAARTLTFESR